MTERKTIGFGVPNELRPPPFHGGDSRCAHGARRHHGGLRSEGRFERHAGIDRSLQAAARRMGRDRRGGEARPQRAPEGEETRHQPLEQRTQPSRTSAGTGTLCPRLGRRGRDQRTHPERLTELGGPRPDERWWLFSMAAATTGAAEDVDIGWRKAIRIALTENPTGEEATAIRAKRRKSKGAPLLPLPLFEDR